MNENKLEVFFKEDIKNNDIFWMMTIKKYFEENLKDKSDDEKFNYLGELYIDRDVFNEFINCILYKTYQIDGAINVNGRTAESIAKENSNKSVIEVYIDLANYKASYEQSLVREGIEKSKFVYNHSRGSLLPSNKNFNEIVVTDDFIYKKLNGKSSFIKDPSMVKKVQELLSEKVESIKKYSELEKQLGHERNNFKDKITIKINDNLYSINKSVNSTEEVDFFSRIVTDVLSIVDVESGNL